MATEQNPAIALLVAKIEELERNANAYRIAVNVLCEKDGGPPMFPDAGGGPHEKSTGTAGHREAPVSSAQIKSDSFYGKRQQTAVRELLAIRKTTGAGPAKPAEILQALRDGGYQVEAKNDDIALVGLRAMLRKRSTIFHKLPNGTWGLREWYPNTKSSKDSDRGSAAKDAGAQNGQETKAEESDSEPDARARETSAA